jgi:hypothetical protein
MKDLVVLLNFCFRFTFQLIDKLLNYPEKYTGIQHFQVGIWRRSQLVTLPLQ